MSNLVVVWDFCGTGRAAFSNKIKGTLLSLTDTQLYIVHDGILSILSYDLQSQTIYTPRAVLQIACNSNSVLLLLDSQEVWGYSSNPYSPLFPNPNSSPSNLQKIDLIEIRSISLGPNHAGAINLSNKLFTWGKGKFGELGSGNVHKHGPILSKKSEIFCIEQVLCGNKFTLIRTQGGYIYIFGLLPKGSKCISDSNAPTDNPYTILSLESEYFTQLCSGDEFVAGLSSGKIFVFDGCLRPIKLGIEHKEISVLASSKKFLLGIDAYKLYLWEFGSGGGECGLDGWSIKVILLNSGFVGCKVLGGVGEFFGFFNVVEDCIGRVLPCAEYEQEIEVEKIEVKKVENKELKWEKGIWLLADGIKGFLRKVIRKIAWGNENLAEQNIKVLYNCTELIFRKRLKLVWNLLRILAKPAKNPEKSIRKALIYLKCILSFHIKSKNLRIFNRWKHLLTIQNPLKPLSLVLNTHLKPIFLSTVAFHRSQNITLFKQMISLLAKQYQIMTYLSKSRCLQKLRIFSILSRKQIEHSSTQKKYNYIITPSSEFQLKTAESLNNPLNRAEHSPRQNNRKFLAKDSRVKSKPRALSKPLNIDKSKGPEKTKGIRKGPQYVDESKNRQIKTKLLKITQSQSKENDFDRSPLSPSRITGVHKLSAFIFILSSKVSGTLRHIFHLLKQKKHTSSFSFAPDGNELLPVIAPEIWKLKVFSLGINKIHAAIKRHIKVSVLSYLLSN